MDSSQTDDVRRVFAGRYIALDGPDGVGKTEQLKRVQEMCLHAGLEPLFIREPGSTLVGEGLREILLHRQADKPLFPQTQALLFMAARAQLAREVIAPVLAAGRPVLADRCVASTWAYQRPSLTAAEQASLYEVYNLAVPIELRPHLILILDAPVEVCRARLRRRDDLKDTLPEARDHFQSQDLAYFAQVRKEYERFSTTNSCARTVHADRPPDALFAAICNQISLYFCRHG